MRFAHLFLLIVVLVSGVSAQVKQPSKPAEKIPFAESLQAVVVTTADDKAATGRAQLFTRKDQRSKWQSVGSGFDVVVGRNGLAWSKDSAPEKVTEFKQEGDGKAPAGLFPLLSTFGTPDKPSKVGLAYTKIGEYTECVDDVNSGHYNKIVDRMKVGNYDWKSSEKMLEVGEEYSLGIVVGHNSFPVTKGDGSCIFLHVWKDAATGTSGCTAMHRRDIEYLFSWISNEQNPYLVQMTQADYKKYRKKWNLPKL